MKLNLKRPMVFFDLETTGTDISKDRIVEISVVKVMPDGWTVLTSDGSLSAHFEHTVAITADGPKIMTLP